MSQNFMSGGNATSVLTAFANTINGKQPKTLANPVMVGGVQKTTVESALSALSDINPSGTITSSDIDTMWGNS